MKKHQINGLGVLPKTMTTDELQKVIDSNLKIISSEGKFRITVAREGMIWDSNISTSRIEEKMREKLQEFSDSKYFCSCAPVY